MSKKKHKTITGALPNSAGFPGKNMIKKEKIVYTEEMILAARAELREDLEEYFRSNNDHKYWE